MKITAVGGYEAVGRNLTGVTVNGETVALDNGIRLDTLQLYDEDTSRLKNKPLDELLDMKIVADQRKLDNIQAQVISHGHLDHFAGVAVHRPQEPIYSLPYTCEMMKKEYREGDYNEVYYQDPVDITRNFTLEFIEVTHSIPYASFAILHTPEGAVVYASDFRFDNNSIIAKTDYKRLKELGKENVRALISESTRVENPGKTPSEEVVRKQLTDLTEFLEEGLIVTTTFSTHLERVQALIDEARRIDRIPVVLGRSLSKSIAMGRKYGLLDVPKDMQIYSSRKTAKRNLVEIEEGNREDYFLIVTGHQGEPNSMLTRLVEGRLPIRFQENDSVIFSTTVIPTPLNRASRYVLDTKLRDLGVRIFDNVHISGHASKEDHRKLIRMLDPDHIIPCHGSLEMRGNNAELGKEEGYMLEKDLHLLNNGGSVNI